jgi:hypothetical protein
MISGTIHASHDAIEPAAHPPLRMGAEEAVLDACPLHPERGERWRRAGATERGSFAASAKRRRRGGTWRRPRRLRHARAQSSRLRHARPRAGHPCLNARPRETAGEGLRFFTTAHVPAVPAWTLGSRSASRRLPVDDEAERRRRRGISPHPGGGGDRRGTGSDRPGLARRPLHPSSQTPRLSSICTPIPPRRSR